MPLLSYRLTQFYRLKLDQKEHELRQSSDASREVDRLIRQLKDERNLEKAQQISAQLRQERADKVRQVNDVNAEVIKLEEQNLPSASSRPLRWCATTGASASPLRISTA